jgi:Ni/Co efflux regulator RcnB
MNISAKRVLLAAATVSSLAAVMAPQAASAAQVYCQGRQECETRNLHVGRERTVYYYATARQRDGDRARGHCEMRNARFGYRVMDRNFYGSTGGRSNVFPHNPYKMSVESNNPRARVTALLWTN